MFFWDLSPHLRLFPHIYFICVCIAPHIPVYYPNFILKKFKKNKQRKKSPMGGEMEQGVRKMLALHGANLSSIPGTTWNVPIVLWKPQALTRYPK